VGALKQAEFLSFEDSENGRTWLFDLTFLLSPWKCIYGAGCKGVLKEDATALQHGCCSHGAHFVTETDVEKVELAKQRLTPEQWQFAPVAGRLGWLDPTQTSGVAHTRLHEGACIFLNRPGFEGGAGCALHNAAVQAGNRPMDWKPLVCWQLPLRLTETTDTKGHSTVTLREWKRRDWGDGGADFHWWCTEAPDAFVGKEPVYVYLKDEITETIGAAMYARLAEALDRRRSETVVMLHPALQH
jgi:hypothetical protein